MQRLPFCPDIFSYALIIAYLICNVCRSLTFQYNIFSTKNA
nr:MAG TPA: hypothetical protein [Caudoviricetes sp.]